MAMVLSKQRFDFICKATIEKLKKKFQKPKYSKKYVFLAKCIEHTMLREIYCKKIEENEPEKLNKLFITDSTLK